MTKPMSRPYQRIFLATYGGGPWPCYVCGKDVTKLVVHHIDENPSNNDPVNLSPVHRSCHMSLHQAGKPKTQDQRDKLSAILKGRTFSAETRLKMGDARRGKPIPAETRARMSAALTGRTLSDEHKRNLSESRKRRKELS